MLYECRHILPNGEKCRAIALRGNPFCYFHTSAHRLTGQPPVAPTEKLRLPIIEDQTSVQLAVATVLDALSSSRLDARQAGIFLNGIRIAARTMQLSLVPIPSRSTVTNVTQSEFGDDLAPQRRICEAPDDCVHCPEKSACKDYKPVATDH